MPRTAAPYAQGIACGPEEAGNPFLCLPWVPSRIAVRTANSAGTSGTHRGEECMALGSISIKACPTTQVYPSGTQHRMWHIRRIARPVCHRYQDGTADAASGAGHAPVSPAKKHCQSYRRQRLPGTCKVSVAPDSTNFHSRHNTAWAEMSQPMTTRWFGASKPYSVTTEPGLKSSIRDRGTIGLPGCAPACNPADCASVCGT